MSDEKVLTKEIADQFLADEDSVDLSEFTAIEDDAAESLSKYDDGLDLSGLTELSDVAAEVLANAGGGLSLNGLKSLSDAAAKSLSKCSSRTLVLGGLDDISDNGIFFLLEAFGVGSSRFGWHANLYLPLSFEYDYFRKEVWNIPEVIPDTFQDFLIHQNLVYHYVDGADDGGRYLKSVLPTPDSADSYNPILGELSHREAEKLCRFEGSDVVLNGWYSVDSTEVLQLLCNAKFSSLSIKVSAITSEVAKILVGFRASSLRVDAEDIDEEAARIIAACPKDLGVNLESLPRHVRAVLRKHPAMHEWGTVSLPMFSASCNVCGFEKTFELLDGDDHSYGMFYYTSDKRLEKEGWLEDDETGLAFCPSCNKDDRIQQYLDEARDYR